jgi:uncharacterized protein (DUF983 family)
MAVALRRGALGRCPACGNGALLQGFAAPQQSCKSCGESLGQYQAADFAAYFVTFLVGAIFTPLTVAAAMRPHVSDVVIWVLLAGAVLTALLLLPRAKGAVIGLLWALNVHNV